MMNTYRKAVKSFNEGNYKAAHDLIEKLNAVNKNNPDILFFLAVLKSKNEEYESAASLYKEVIRLRKDHTEAHYNLALCLQNQGKNDEALAVYQKALELNPFLSEAHNNIAVIYKSMGKYEESEKAFRMAVKAKPGNFNAMSNLSNLSISHKLNEFRDAFELIERKDFSSAKNLLIKHLEKNPGNIQLLSSLGIAYSHLNNYEKALECFKEILSFNENNAEAQYSAGVCCQNLDNNDLALQYYKKALELNPQYIDALNNLGLLYSSLKNYDEAARCFTSALKYNPSYFNSLINLGTIFLQKDDFEGAMNYFNKALDISTSEKNNESKSVAYSNIGFVYLRRKNIPEALKYFDKGIELNPESVLAHYNKAEALLVTGQFEEGWKEYEWRQGRKDFGKRKFKNPFKPEYELKDKRILVYAEQGLGDALQFVRYLPMLKEKGCYIIFECGKEMHPLLQGFNGADEIIERNFTEAPSIKYDYEIPLLSLPLYFKTNIDNIPTNVPYLPVDKALKQKWADAITDDGKIKIGIVWAGSPIHTNDRHRSVRLQQFLPLLSAEGTHFYTLQKGFQAIQAKDYRLLVTDLDEYIKSFADTSAIIESLDLVITVDTSVAHLAGALGKKTWLLLPYLPDWRWMLEGDGSPWYPSLKLYRQPRINDWDSVFKILKKDLSVFVENTNQLKNKNSKALLDDDLKRHKPGFLSGVNNKLYLGLTSGENFGWGVCSKYLKKELSKKLNIINIDEHEELIKTGKADGTVFHALNNNDFSGLHPVRGTKNIGYTFFEFELSNEAVRKAPDYNLILGGSSWNELKLREKGIENTGVLIQGIDPWLFYPGEKEKNNDLFVIFSGGKFELRKGQDLVLKAVKIMQQKYPDIILINAWYNMWPHTMHSMDASKHIKFEYKGETWKNFMVNLCRINDINGDKVFTLPITPNHKLRDLYMNTDIGLFPNRCEGGTNLVLMEYMACGKPVVASYNSGHKDIITEKNSLPLMQMHEFKLHDNDKKLIADWLEPDIDEIAAKLEYAYFNRDIIKKIGNNAGEDLKNYTWERSAESLLNHINRL